MRAAAAMTLHRLHNRDRDNLVRRTHPLVIVSLFSSDVRSPDVIRRCDLTKFPISKQRFVGFVARSTIDDTTGPIRDR